MTADIVLPRILDIGAGASAKLPAVLQRLGLQRPFIITDPFMLEHGPVHELQRSLRANGMASGLFSETVPDPTSACVGAAVAALGGDDHDCVIGIGGGSPLDTAKAVALLAARGGEMRDYKVPHRNDTPGLPVVAIPTTAGTGSEATRFTVISDSETKEKMLCAGAAFCPTAALVDYELTLTMPKRLTADTGLDTLTHCIEAYVSRRRNPFSDSMALSGMRLVYDNICKAYDEPGNRDAREAMMLAATQGGIAFSNASVALVHGMSRPIGALFHVPHGLSNAMLLPRITAFSAEADPERYAQCARAMGVAGATDDPETAVSRLVNALTALNRELNVPTPQQYGIPADDYFAQLQTMAEQAEASGSPANNPRIPSIEEMRTLYRQCYA
ncbi:iron-containing alcohol dehydrogenase [Arhodomonas sp. AD133]|uniref:iron-containing alcohol dehydrogenase n=1 Tax=Arhodomonas sp. AD133 TaxID=3415009 RepID=UPI003EC05C5C